MEFSQQETVGGAAPNVRAIRCRETLSPAHRSHRMAYHLAQNVSIWGLLDEVAKVDHVGRLAGLTNLHLDAP